MAPRPRKRGKKDLPDNLYVSVKNGVSYYQYKHPVSGKFVGFGTDKSKAVQAAKHVNDITRQDADLLKTTQDALRSKDSLGSYLCHFRDVILPAKRVKGEPLSSTTLREYRRVLNVLIEKIGTLQFNKITQRDLALYLNSTSSNEVYNKHRQMLVMVFRHAVSDEKIAGNLAEKIIKRDSEKTKRSPLTLEMYQAIYDQARPAIRNAMELSLNVMHRRADIQRWRFDSRTESDGDMVYRTIVQKTRKHGNEAYIEIPASLPAAFSAAGARTLYELVENCRDDSLCPFLVHERPKRRKLSAEKEHMLQLSVKQISDGFAEAREAAGIAMKNPPTFHELIALGQSLRAEQGWDLTDIQKLRGHKKLSTTKIYQDRHFKWTRFEPPLNKKVK